MIRLSVFYPSTEGAPFDHDYYRNKHVPLAVKTWGLDGAEIDKGVDGPYVAAVHFKFESLEAVQAAMGNAGTADVLADVANYTSIRLDTDQRDRGLILNGVLASALNRPTRRHRVRWRLFPSDGGEPMMREPASRGDTLDAYIGSVVLSGSDEQVAVGRVIPIGRRRRSATVPSRTGSSDETLPGQAVT